MTVSRSFFALLTFAVCASAAPILRLSGTDLRPVWIQQGANGPTNVSFEAYNAGDGALNPQARGSHTWLNPVVDAARPCSFEAALSCRPVRVLFNSTALAAGVYEGVIAITDGGAFDAPQFVKVKIYVGGNVPNRLDFYLPATPGAADSVTFQTPVGSPPGLRPTTQSGGTWLAASSSGMGSFQYVYTHTIAATVQGGQAAGDYNGAVAVTGSTFAPDNRSVNVVLHVTAQPVARPSAAEVKLRGLTGGAAVERDIAVTNGGSGALNVTGVATAGGAWLTASVETGNVVRVRAAAGSLAAAFYNGTVTINSNAANNPVTLPVEFELVAAGVPLTDFGGVIDAASFSVGRPVGGGALASLFGSQLAPSVAQADSIPLPTVLAGTSVFVNDVAAPLIFVSPGQINFQMPWGVTGTAQVRVERAGQRGNTITVPAARRGAGIYGFPGTTYGIVINASRSEAGLVFAWPDIPALAGIPKAAARPGDVLVFYGSGLGPVNPAGATGAAAGADPLSRVIETPQVAFGSASFGGPQAAPSFVGLTPGFVGLFQINVQVPASVPTNPHTAIRLEWSDNTFSNTVDIAVERP